MIWSTDEVMNSNGSLKYKLNIYQLNAFQEEITNLDFNYVEPYYQTGQDLPWNLVGKKLCPENSKK